MGWLCWPETKDTDMNATDLKQIRELLGWTQARLARELRISRRTLENWEQGRNMIPACAATVIRQIADREEK